MSEEIQSLGKGSNKIGAELFGRIATTLPKTYCEGACQNNEFKHWVCNSFDNYPDQGPNWKTPTPTGAYCMPVVLISFLGIVLSRIWLMSLILVSICSLFFIANKSDRMRIGFVSNSMFAFTLLTNAYVYNLMESTANGRSFEAYYSVNAHNSSTVCHGLSGSLL